MDSWVFVRWLSHNFKDNFAHRTTRIMIRLFLNRFALPVNVEDVQFAYRLLYIFRLAIFFSSSSSSSYFLFLLFCHFLFLFGRIPHFEPRVSLRDLSKRVDLNQRKSCIFFLSNGERERKKKKAENIDDVYACKRPSSNYWNQLPAPWYSTIPNQCEWTKSSSMACAQQRNEQMNANGFVRLFVDEKLELDSWLRFIFVRRSFVLSDSLTYLLFDLMDS